jgi:hypothetical protein
MNETEKFFEEKITEKVTILGYCFKTLSWRLRSGYWAPRHSANVTEHNEI